VAEPSAVAHRRLPPGGALDPAGGMPERQSATPPTSFQSGASPAPGRASRAGGLPRWRQLPALGRASLTTSQGGDPFAGSLESLEAAGRRRATGPSVGGAANLVANFRENV
jgi:hypothetical protein